ncbi:uncharacterized protein BXZ73DRAFT_101388 [Epithele typhae]|uniref:uncharacterized protein n=1 Tax=Epithele typhae TaxID=378194 RepID=UPI002007FCD5|nr:uncharacterized protein BXZ73DRAFT_101388 [Epithele typhae]KAH9932008.1 hypothetical protein BXZ73DRAFT_101388 [Epithele typhae]
MSARAPFVPRPASRVDVGGADLPSPSDPPPSVESTFRPNGLLYASDGHRDLPPSPATFKPKPKNFSGLLGPVAQRNAGESRSSINVSGRSAKPFSSVQHKHLASSPAPRPASPFLPGPPRGSYNASLAHPRPSPAQELKLLAPPRKMERIYSPTHQRTARKTTSSILLTPSDTLRLLLQGTLLDRSLVSRTQVFLDNTNTDEDELDDNFSDPVQMDDENLQPHMSAMKRQHDMNDDQQYGTSGKRFKAAAQDVYGVGPNEYTSFSSQHEMDTRRIGVDDGESKQALYRLLGQDLEACIEERAEEYERARKKWAECSDEEWANGANVHGGADRAVARFGKMLDFVKDRMS